MPAIPNALNSFDPTTVTSHDDEAAALAGQAERCRRLAAAIGDRETSDLLSRMAEGYERNAAALRRHH